MFKLFFSSCGGWFISLCFKINLNPQRKKIFHVIFCIFDKYKEWKKIYILQSRQLPFTLGNKTKEINVLCVVWSIFIVLQFMKIITCVATTLNKYIWSILTVATHRSRNPGHMNYEKIHFMALKRFDCCLYYINRFARFVYVSIFYK